MITLRPPATDRTGGGRQGQAELELDFRLDEHDHPSARGGACAAAGPHQSGVQPGQRDWTRSAARTRSATGRCEHERQLAALSGDTHLAFGPTGAAPASELGGASP